MSAEAKSTSSGARVRHAPSVAWQRVGDEVVVLDVPRRTLVGLNGTASALWEALASESDLAAGADAVAARLQQPAAGLIDEVEQIAQALIRRELLQVVATLPVGAGPAHAAPASPASAGETPEALPGILWEEQLEASGVYAACAKDEFGEGGPQCTSSPSAGSS
ncbi:MAG: PqqD family protein [Proteobacteria bacterium]|nr:PqqD family protein [Pseudomonadota bacterium]